MNKFSHEFAATMKTNLKVAGLGLAVAAAMGGLAGCGGSGAGAGGPSIVPTEQSVDQATQYTIQIATSSRVLASDGTTPVDLTVIVTNQNGVAAQDVAVDFAVNDALSATRLEVTQAKTDASGVAQARLHLNGNAAERTVKVLASVGKAMSGEIDIQVASTSTSVGGGSNSSRGQLSVRMGTDSFIADLKEKLSYEKRYAIIVSDNAGIPKPNATVTATLRPKSYAVGYWAPCATCGTAKWGQVLLSAGQFPAGIPSEDLANFGTCDAGEDANGDKVLTPGNVVSYQVEGQTDSAGLAVMSIVYPKSFANWVSATVEVTASVGGTEAFNALTIPLPILAADVTTEGTSPPSIDRLRGSLSTNRMEFPLTTAETTAGLTLTDNVAGSPFPYLSITPTCP